MGRYWFSQNFFFSINAKLAADLLYQSINSISDKNGNPDQRGPISPVKLLYYRLAGALPLYFLEVAQEATRAASGTGYIASTRRLMASCSGRCSLLSAEERRSCIAMVVADASHGSQRVHTVDPAGAGRCRLAPGLRSTTPLFALYLLNMNYP